LSLSPETDGNARNAASAAVASQGGGASATTGGKAGRSALRI
jgi:hypothetical protein